jgi:hypothetical protein
MSETFTTTTLNLSDNNTAVKELEMTAMMESDEVRFYYSIRKELDRLKRNPSEISVDIILNYSKSLR